jgi:hypothetical protein
MAKQKAAKAKKKKGLPPVLHAWQVCRTKSGIKPGQKMTAKQKREAQACVDQFLEEGK